MNQVYKINFQPLYRVAQYLSLAMQNILSKSKWGILYCFDIFSET